MLLELVTEHVQTHLPEDLLREIFLLYARDACIHPYDGLYRRPDIRNSLVLTRVCRLWRSIALSMSSLWSSFKISIRQDSDPLSILKVLTFWLSLSGSFPLQFELHISTSHQCQCLDTLRLHSRRWKTVRIVTDTPGLIQRSSWGQLTPAEVPLLQEFHIVDYYPQHTSYGWCDLPFLNANIHLRSFALNRYIGTFSFPQVCWGNLHRLKLTGLAGPLLGVHALLDILAQCHNVKELHVSYPSSSAEGYRDTPLRVTLPHLRDLYLSFKPSSTHDSLWLGNVISCLTAPSLKNLWLRHSEVSSLPILNALIRRSECALSRVYLLDVRPDSDMMPLDFTEFLGLLSPSLKLLRLKMANVIGIGEQPLSSDVLAAIIESDEDLNMERFKWENIHMGLELSIRSVVHV